MTVQIESTLSEWLRYEYRDAKSHKFWEIRVRPEEMSGLRLRVRWGRVGTQGQEKAWRFHSLSNAIIAAEKRIAEKIEKGYRQVHVGGETANPYKHNCAWCGLSFTCEPVTSSGRNFCSVECREKYEKPKGKKKAMCAGCDATILQTVRCQQGRKFCSVGCRDAYYAGTEFAHDGGPPKLGTKTKCFICSKPSPNFLGDSQFLHGTKWFCSKECGEIGATMVSGTTPKTNVKAHKCIECGQTWHSSLETDDGFCSLTCRDAAKAENEKWPHLESLHRAALGHDDPEEKKRDRHYREVDL